MPPPEEETAVVRQAYADGLRDAQIENLRQTSIRLEGALEAHRVEERIIWKEIATQLTDLQAFRYKIVAQASILATIAANLSQFAWEWFTKR